MKFTKQHEWVNKDGDNAVTGITEYAAAQLGDVVFVEMPSVGDVVKQGKRIGTIESVKTVSDMHAAVSGEIIEINEEIEEDPSIVNEDPQGNGWFMKIKMSDPEEINALLDAEQYKEICE